MTEPSFAGNVVVLTGASRGIGRELALQLADQGAILALAARGTDPLEEVASLCRQRGTQATSLPTDVTDEQQCQRLIEQTIATYGRIDTLLLDAGFGTPRLFANMTDLTALKTEIALNYLGVVNCVFYALPYLRQSKGRVVGVNSFGGLVGIPGTIGYNSSKHAMRDFLTTLRVELRGSGVSVTVVFPGAISTERLHETMGDNMQRVPTMSPERCATITLQAAVARKRQVVMTFPGKLLVWMNLLAPTMLDRLLTSIGGTYME